jgi:hypothetical protein
MSACSMDTTTRLQRLQNSLVAVHSLSEDVLVEILSYCKPIYSATKWTSARQIREFLWVSHVCWLWRKISCDVSHFWNVIPDHNLQLAHLFLERSRSSPLSMTLPIGRHLFLGGIEGVMGHFSRVRHLRVDFSRDRDESTPERLTSAMSPHQTPQLETLYCNGARQGVKFPHSAVLRKLELRRCRLFDGWRFPATGSIRSISLIHTRITSAADMINFLRALPELQRIRIYQAPILRGPREGLPIAALPQLTSLSMRQISEDDLLLFLRHIHCPQLQSLVVHTRSQVEPVSLETLFRSEMVASVLRRLPKERLSATVDINAGRVEVRAHQTTLAGKHIRVLDLHVISISSWTTDYIPIVVFEANDLRVQDLTVDIPGISISKEAWTLVLELYSNTLVKITASNPVSIAHLFVAMTDGELARDTADTAAGFLPHLVEISVHNVSLTDVIDGVQLGDLMQAALIARAQSGRKLHKVNFWSCGYVSGTYVKEFKCEGVIAVEVDN